MQIDWFTFTCQVINFLVLVWLLKRLLYRPVLNAVEERERGIAQRLRSAAERETAADSARQAYESQQAELAHLKDTLLADAAADVENWRKQQQTKVREEVAERQAAWHAAVARDQQQFLGELRLRTAREVQEIVRHVLQELAGHELERQSIHQFLSHLDELLTTNPAVATRGGEFPLVVRTAFPLSEAKRDALAHQLATRLGNHSVRFEVDEELICGIELVTGDRKLEWNVDHYLNSLERSITTALDQRLLAHSTP